MAGVRDWRLAVRLARREMRGAITSFRVFLICLALGVGAIAAVNSLSTGVLDALREDGQIILGGDLAVSNRFVDLTPQEVTILDAVAEARSRHVTMRTMARAPEAGLNTLVELKAVDGAYPLFGDLALSDGLAVGPALGQLDGAWGAVVDAVVLGRLDAELGDRITIGDAEFELRAVIDREPDRAGGGFLFGPRLMISSGALADTQLLQPGSLVTFTHLIDLAPGQTAPEAIGAIRAATAEQSFRIQDFTDASPQLETLISRLSLFLTMVGLTALLVGGVGIANSTKAYLDGRLATIATLKCLGAPQRLIFQVYFCQIMALTGLGTLIGLAFGVVVPMLGAWLLADALPVRVALGPYPGALALAAGFGLLTALTFTLWPLSRAREVPAAALFRDTVQSRRRGFGGVWGLAVAASGLALAALAVLSHQPYWIALWFVGGAAVTVLAFRLAAAGVIAWARSLGRPRNPGLRLALTNLYRPGAPTGEIVLSLGLGLTVLVAIAVIEGNMTRQIAEELPEEAPAYFLVDIQPDQIGPITDDLLAMDGVDGLERVPSLRGRIVAVNGVPAQDALVDMAFAWLLEGDRGVTYSDARRDNHLVVEGEWWPQDYSGPPLVSIYQDIGAAFGIGIGDRITVNILGRDLEAEVANLRDIDWTTFGINFTLVYTPNPLSGAPHTFLATVEAEDSADRGLQRHIGEAYPNVTAVRVKDALEIVGGIIQRIGTAIRSTAGVTVLAGVLVLAGAVAAGHRRRVYDAVVLKVLGATRRDVLQAFLIEYGLLGLMTAGIAAVIGSIAGWAVITFVMAEEWIFLPVQIGLTALAAAGITLAFGFAGTWRALGQKAAPLLRNE